MFSVGGDLCGRDLTAAGACICQARPTQPASLEAPTFSDTTKDHQHTTYYKLKMRSGCGCGDVEIDNATRVETPGKRRAGW